MADNGAYARYQYQQTQNKIRADAAARAKAQDTNTNPPVKPLTETQSTSPNVPPKVNNGTKFDSGSGGNTWDTPTAKKAITQEFDSGSGGNTWDTPTAKTNIGIGAQDDATGVDAAVAKQAALNKQGSTQDPANSVTRRPPVQPRPNLLDRFNNYTYVASVYLMSPSDYTTFLRSEKRSVNGYNLLFQSGGAPANVGGFKGVKGANNQANAQDAAAGGLGSGVLGTTVPGANDADAGRNPAFPQDFYIDSISLTTLATGTTSSAHSAAEFKMTVIEPMNISLLDRLYEAVQDHNPKGANGAVNYVSAQYLLVIRFYGYDEQGNMVRVGAIDEKTGLTDPNAAIEKFIPFIIRNINWSIGKSAVSYEFDCAPVPTTIPLSSDRGTVPYDIELTNQTVGQVLGGIPAITNNSATTNPGAPTTTKGVNQEFDSNGSDSWDASPPAKADAAKNPSGTLSGGLMQALTEFRKNLTQQTKGGDPPVFEQYDEFAIEFIGEAKQLIENATVVLPSDKDAKSTAMGETPTTNANAANPNANSKDTKSKSFKIVAGQPIIQVLEQIIRQSSFIYNQQVVKLNADNTVEATDDTGNNSKQVNWFNITFKVEPKTTPDLLRNDYAYKITYYVSIFPINKYESKYFPVAGWPGVHKSYPWWFTGQNTAIIDYQETFNQAYQNLVSGTGNKDSNQEIRRRTLAQSQREIAINSWGPRSTESAQGARDREYEAAANLAGSLYEPDALVNAQMRIIGDPAWIMQGSIANGINIKNLLPGTSTGFLPDGTINFDYSQVFFEVNWNQPSDYDINTGVANPITNKGQVALSRVYIAKEVLSEFKQGKFEQTIKGALFTLPKPDGSNLAPGKSGVNTQNTVPAAVNSTTNQNSGVSTLPPFDPGSGGNSWDAPRNTTSAGGQGGGSTLPAPAFDPGSGGNSWDAPRALGLPLGSPPATSPENPPKPATSNGVIAGIKNFFAPAKLTEATARSNAADLGAIAQRNRQLLAKDQ